MFRLLYIFCLLLFFGYAQAQQQGAKNNPFELNFKLKKTKESVAEEVKRIKPDSTKQNAQSIQPIPVIRDSAKFLFDEDLEGFEKVDLEGFERVDPNEVAVPVSQEEESQIIPPNNQEEVEAELPQSKPNDTLLQNPFNVSSSIKDNSLSPTLDKDADAGTDITPKKKSYRSVFWIFLLVLFLLTVIVNFDRGLINKIYRSILNSNYSNLMFRQQSKGPSVLPILLYVLFIINLGLFLFMGVDKFTDFQHKYFSLPTCILGVGLVYLIRHVVLGLLGTIFPVRTESNQFGFNIMFFNIFLGLIMIPLNLFIAYGPETLSKAVFAIGLFFLIVFFFLRQVRGLFISRNLLMFHKFHFFMYLCAIEIAPYFLLYRLLQ